MFQSRTNFVCGIILLLKRNVILKKDITYISEGFHRHAKMMQIEDEAKTIDAQKEPAWRLPSHRAGKIRKKDMHLL